MPTGNLISQDYSKECVAMAEKKDSNFAVGLISQSRLSQDLNLIQFTPGVNLSMAGDQLGQRYVTVEKAVCEKGADVIIVGRGITGSEDVQQAARKYQEAGWNAISKRCQ